MKQDAGYVIEFSGLDNGNYTFGFPISDSFFSQLDYSEIRKGKLEVDVVLERGTHALLLNFHIKGTVHILCDHCAEYFDLDVEGSPHLIVKLGDTRREDSDEEITIPESDSEIDLRQYIYEFISLLIPYRRVHPGKSEDIPGCSNDVLDKLAPPEEQYEADDPRWNKLKNLKF
ncbi:MAG: DUF177 domain-containing protein [Bacteroidota bacterium]